jgi:transposase
MKQDSKITLGIDVGDKKSHLCLLDDASGEVLEESQLPTTRLGFERYFAGKVGMKVVLETGTHSAWISQMLESYGHEVIVANARAIKLVYGNQRKHDQLDAENLARLARVDTKLLAPIKHRSEQTQADLAILKARDALVRSRSLLINHVRGMVKSFGSRLPSGGTDAFARQVQGLIPKNLESALLPMLESIEGLNQQIQVLEKTLTHLAQKYPETVLLQKVAGVGIITSLAFVLTLEDPNRFSKSRDVGAFLGLVPSRDQSGERDPQRSISKQGNTMLRTLLVQSASYILQPRSPDCDLKRLGQKLILRGGKAARQRAVVAVARKLAVLLHVLWSTGSIYEPLKNSQPANAHMQTRHALAQAA